MSLLLSFIGSFFLTSSSMYGLCPFMAFIEALNLGCGREGSVESSEDANGGRIALKMCVELLLEGELLLDGELLLKWG
jgi:hypothetical protein